MVHCQRRASALSLQPPASRSTPSTSSLSRIENCSFRPIRCAVAAQHAHAQRVEGADHQVLGGTRADQRLGALAHLGRGLVGEGDGGDVLRLDAALQQPRDLVHDDPRLARAGTGQHQARPATGGAPPASARRSGKQGRRPWAVASRAAHDTGRPAAQCAAHKRRGRRCPVFALIRDIRPADPRDPSPEPTPACSPSASTVTPRRSPAATARWRPIPAAESPAKHRPRLDRAARC